MTPPSSTSLTDEELLERVAHGDAESFRVLVSRYEGIVRAIATRKVGVDLADDVAQNVWLKVWRSPPDAARRSYFRAWLSTVVNHECIDHGRRNARRPDALVGDVADASGSTALDALIVEETVRRKAEAFKGCVETLDPESRMIIEGRMRGVDDGETAERLKTTRDAIQQRVHRIKEKLKKCVERALK